MNSNDSLQSLIHFDAYIKQSTNEMYRRIVTNLEQPKTTTVATKVSAKTFEGVSRNLLDTRFIDIVRYFLLNFRGGGGVKIYRDCTTMIDKVLSNKLNESQATNRTEASRRQSERCLRGSKQRCLAPAAKPLRIVFKDHCDVLLVTHTCHLCQILYQCCENTSISVICTLLKLR